MNLKKLANDFVESKAFLPLVLTSCLALLFGSFVLGVTGASLFTIKAGAFLKNYQKPIAKVAFYSLVATGAGGSGVVVSLVIAVHASRYSEEQNSQGEERLALLMPQQDTSDFIKSQCQNCRFYHGQTYGGTPLICAVHPEGKPDCAEFEAKNQCADW